MYTPERQSFKSHLCSSHASPVGFPQDADLWEGLKHRAAKTLKLDLLFQRSGWESFHNCLCWLHTSLDATESWNGKDAVLLHLSSSNGNKALEDLRALLLLQLKLLRKSLCHSAFGHGLGAALHACCLHGLHCLHGLLCHSVEERRIAVTRQDNHYEPL